MKMLANITCAVASGQRTAGAGVRFPCARLAPDTQRLELRHTAFARDIAHFVRALGIGDGAPDLSAWFDANGISYKVQDFRWIGWRGVFLTDPDGNTVELVSAGWPARVGD